MIPASYLFKTTYHDAWEKPEPARPSRAHGSERNGLLRLVLDMVRAAMVGRQTRGARGFGLHAYE